MAVLRYAEANVLVRDTRWHDGVPGDRSESDRSGCFEELRGPTYDFGERGEYLKEKQAVLSLSN